MEDGLFFSYLLTPNLVEPYFTRPVISKWVVGRGGVLARHRLLCMGGFLEGTEDTVSDDLSARPRQYRESQVGFAKSSVCDRQQFANQVCKLGPLLGSWRKRAIKCLVVTQQPFSPLGFSEKLSQNTGDFLCFVGDSVKFLCSRD